MQTADPGHGLDHVVRVVENAERLSLIENANPFVVGPAAWLHDCVLVAKNSPERSRASRLAAAKAIELLKSSDYPSSYESEILHAIEAHSFSAALDCRTLEARIVQDADRLEALGSIGIARCLMTAGAIGQALYDLDEPFPITRIADDRKQSVDHFFVKLFKLPATMKTEAGRVEAQKRITIMVQFLDQLANELGIATGALDRALAAVRNS